MKNSLSSESSNNFYLSFIFEKLSGNYDLRKYSMKTSWEIVNKRPKHISNIV